MLTTTNGTTATIAPEVATPQRKPIVRIIPSVAELMAEDKSIEPDKLRVAAYARVSTEQEEQQSSYEAQVSYYTNYIENHSGWEFAGIYADEGISGTNTKKRASFNRMINDAMSGQIDLILTKSISRFARNTVDTLSIVRKLKAKDVEVYFEKENIHSLDPKCEVLLTIMSSLAQEESRSISENVRWGKEKSMANGNVYMPYGHFMGYRKGKDGRPEIVEEEAAIIRKIYTDYLSGKTITKIAEDLTAAGIPTPGGKTKWRISTIRSILSNEKYKGDAILQKTYTIDFLTKEAKKNTGEKPKYIITNSHDAIIEPSMFERAQQELARRSQLKPKKSSRNSPFSNKLLCGDCGSYYGHKVWRKGGRGNERYDVWYCNHRYDGETKCATPTLKETELKAAFEVVLRKLEYENPTYTDELWHEIIDHAIIHKDRIATFKLNDGTEIITTIPKITTKAAI